MVYGKVFSLMSQKTRKELDLLDRFLFARTIESADANRKKKVGGIFASLFPGRSYMENQYSYVKKYPWLLPIAWLNRLVRHLRNKDLRSTRIVKMGNRRVKLLKKYRLIP